MKFLKNEKWLNKFKQVKHKTPHTQIHNSKAQGILRNIFLTIFHACISEMKKKIK